MFTRLRWVSARADNFILRVKVALAAGAEEEMSFSSRVEELAVDESALHRGVRCCHSAARLARLPSP